MYNRIRLFGAVTRVMYTTASVALLLISLAMIGAGGWDVWLAIHSSSQIVERMLDAIGLIVVAVAVFDVSKYLIEEEVLRNRELRSPSEARKTLTKFLVIITIAAYLEALVFIFSAAKQNMAQLIYPTALLGVTTLGVVGLGVFLRLSARAELTGRHTAAMNPIKTIKSALLGEVKSRAFYRLAADLTERDDTRDLLLELSEMESSHARELAEQAVKPPLNLDFDPFNYLRRWEGSVAASISPEERAIITNGGPQAILKLAMQREAASRDSYRDLTHEVDDPLLRSFCENLAQTEQNHLDRLNEVASRYSGRAA